VVLRRKPVPTQKRLSDRCLVYLDPSDIRELDKLAEYSRMSRSAYIRHIVVEHLRCDDTQMTIAGLEQDMPVPEEE
jgi:hypothetical protein